MNDLSLNLQSPFQWIYKPKEELVFFIDNSLIVKHLLQNSYEMCSIKLKRMSWNQDSYNLKATYSQK